VQAERGDEILRVASRRLVHVGVHRLLDFL
jgi:hypothetical protein